MKFKIENLKLKIPRSAGQGQSLIELMITVGLLAIILPALLAGFFAGRNGRVQLEQRQQAIALVREGQEAARVFREADWIAFSNLSGQTVYPHSTSGTWLLNNISAGSLPNYLTGFSRNIQIVNVYRDFTTDPTNAPIVESTAPNAVLDPSTKKILTTVTWSSPVSGSVTATEYLSRNENLSYTETTQAQFDLGTKTTTVTTNDSGGEVKLGPGGGSANWCSPSLTLASQDLPKSGVANGIYAIEGIIFAATGDNSSGISFERVNVTTDENIDPPQTTPISSYDGFKTNGIFGENNYAYIATDNNFKEIDIIDLNNIVGGKYQEAGFYNAPGNGNGGSVYVYGNLGFMTVGTKLYTFDLSSKSGSRSTLGNANLAGTGKRVIVVQDPDTHIIYAYVATSNTSNQLQIFQVSSNGQTISPAGSKALTAPGAIDLFVNPEGSRVYLTTGYSAGQNNVYVLNTSNKSSISVLSSINTGGMSPKGITFIQNRAIVVGTSGTYQYQVFKVDSDILSNCDSSDPSIGKLTVATGVNGVSSVFQSNEQAYSYIITGDAASELKIIRGGAGGSGGAYAPLGTFESKTFDAGHNAAFNYFNATDQTESGVTSILYEISIKAGLTGGSCAAGTTCCANVLFTPGDFTPNPFVPQTALPIKTSAGYSNPGQCLRYKATLSTTDTSKTPILNDVTFNYSP